MTTVLVFWLTGTLLLGLLVALVYGLFHREQKKGVYVVPGFNLGIPEDTQGNYRSAHTFEEWLAHLPLDTRERRKQDTLTNRLGFYLYKRSEKARAHT